MPRSTARGTAGAHPQRVDLESSQQERKRRKRALNELSFQGSERSLRGLFWRYLAEFRDEDANSPVIYARTKLRKAPTYRVPWLTVTPGGELKPKDLEARA